MRIDRRIPFQRVHLENLKFVKSVVEPLQAFRQLACLLVAWPFLPLLCCYLIFGYWWWWCWEWGGKAKGARKGHNFINNAPWFGRDSPKNEEKTAFVVKLFRLLWRDTERKKEGRGNLRFLNPLLWLFSFFQPVESSNEPKNVNEQMQLKIDWQQFSAIQRKTKLLKKLTFESESKRNWKG